MKKYIQFVIILIVGLLIGFSAGYGVVHRTANKKVELQQNLQQQNPWKIPNENLFSGGFEKSIESDFQNFSNLMNKQMENFHKTFESHFKDLNQAQKNAVTIENQKDGMLYKIQLKNPKDEISVKIANGMLNFEEKSSRKDEVKNDKMTKESSEGFISVQTFSLPEGLDTRHFNQEIKGDELRIFIPRKST